MKGFVLAAGLGQRMRPLTDTCPKPLLEVGGKTMLDRALDALSEAGVKEAVVNTHYLAPMIESHLKGRTAPKITLSYEEELLDTAGGVLKMLDFFKGEAFFVLNADIIWTDGAEPALKRLEKAWDPTKMDMLLLLHPIQPGERGDYFLAGETGLPVHHTRGSQPPNTVFAGPRIVHPRIFAGETRKAVGFPELFHRAEAAGRLYGLRHDGGWHHVGTPEEYRETNALLSSCGTGKKCAG